MLVSCVDETCEEVEELVVGVDISDRLDELDFSVGN